MSYQPNDPASWRILILPYKEFVRWEWSVHYWNFVSNSCQCSHCQGSAEGWTEVARGVAWTKKAAERRANSYLPSRIRNKL